MKVKHKWYRKALILLLVLNVVALAGITYQRLQKSIPDYIRLVVNEANEFNFSYPLEVGFEEDAKGVFNINDRQVENNQIRFTG